MKSSTAKFGKLPYDLVVIGASLGGIQALSRLLSELPKGFPLPILIVQHRHKSSDNALSTFLQESCQLSVVEAEDKETIKPGWVYIAPADYHLLIEANPETETERDNKERRLYKANGHRESLSANLGSLKSPHPSTLAPSPWKCCAAGIALSTEAPVCYARPSIDVLFESAADACGKKVIGIILTGASSDGTQGLAKIKAKGGLTIVQEPNNAESRTMPASAIAAVAVDWILSLSEIAPLLINLLTTNP